MMPDSSAPQPTYPKKPEPLTKSESGADRRTAARYPSRLEIVWQHMGLPPRDMSKASILNVSTAGVGISTEHELPVGKTAIIRLHTTTQGWSSHLVRIKYCNQTETGEFQVGCEFVRPLNEQQLQTLLS